MTETKETQKLRDNIRDASLDLADAILDLADHTVRESPRDKERIDSVRVFMHELAGGDRPEAVPHTDVLFAIGAVIDAVGLPGGVAFRDEFLAQLGAMGAESRFFETTDTPRCGRVVHHCCRHCGCSHRCN
jgi:hypothetical protein